MSLWKETNVHYHGYLNLATPSDINLETASQYYKVPGSFTVFNHAGFDSSSDGILTFNEACGHFSLNGTSDIKVSKACILTFGLYKNGVLIPGAETPHTFISSSKISTIAITGILHLLRGDYLEVFAMSNMENILLTPSTLNVTVFGARR